MSNPQGEGDAYRMRKHSVLIDGHQTSVSLEDAFWSALVGIAQSKGVSINRLIAEIDHGRATNLSSALRVFVLEELQAGRQD